MTISPVLFSSDKGEWDTPAELFDEVARRFTVGGFGLDAAASGRYNALAPRYCTQAGTFQGGLKVSADDGLNYPWHQHHYVWCNPPYGRSVGDWVAKAHAEALLGGPTHRVVMLLPARTDTRWFHDHALGKAHLYFIKGRLKFGTATNSAPFPSMLAVYSWSSVDPWVQTTHAAL